ncbi:MAG: hypothetical protein J7545_01475 [Roseofilum sp. SBFL]|uniref:hypothetical protein n=1 Tax=unclassified Roseofilum TaxID=2620099 RepID=UPI001B2838D7|nr:MULTISPECIES: hypothetical protein [unclassified Roseofilum]MBP0011738.1 hypothetical protein [Roseofilum sp. SID3]MBP0024023.1 hypothetical protein [Roseofilum sp. SID2]MBP0027638.1 hypothetical protein [Roseofilum sp. Guam]MBP0039130.1 hypothetical protein [Roseofilum sp. SID1]MBP0040637.1 hypothetical protein [Roseofilum sp. SBFL]
MPVTETQWSAIEEKIAKAAFDTAYRREVASMTAEVKRQAETAASPDELWKLHDFLSARRHDLDGKYDFRDSMLIFVFAELVKEGWLEIGELEGLSRDKISKIKALTII